jgi:hypothetical protein
VGDPITVEERAHQAGLVVETRGDQPHPGQPTDGFGPWPAVDPARNQDCLVAVPAERRREMAPDEPGPTGNRNSDGVPRIGRAPNR